MNARRGSIPPPENTGSAAGSLQTLYSVSFIYANEMIGLSGRKTYSPYSQWTKTMWERKVARDEFRVLNDVQRRSRTT